MRKKTIIIIILVTLLSLTAITTYARYIKTVSKTGTIATTEVGYCKNKNISLFRECLIRNDSQQELTIALSTIDARTTSVNFSNVEPEGSVVTSSSNPGLYKGEDDYTVYSGTTPTDNFTYYYRGSVQNNWVSFGGFLWRVVRINGDGTIRMIYSGLASSSNHTGYNAQIGVASYVNSISKTATTLDISGLTSDTITTTYYIDENGPTYVGYMYNPAMEIATYPDKVPGNTTTTRLNNFPTFNNISNGNNYYYFKNFDPNTDCFTGSGIDDAGACTLKCRSLGNDGDSGVDCVQGSWNARATDTNNYSTTAAGVYPANNPTERIYTSNYKYTCWGYGPAVTKSNSDGTTSVYITCPIVSEIIGTVKDQSTKAKVKYHGLFSQDATTSNSNVKDSNIKTQVDTWYANNIMNKNDGNNHSLESYLSDEIFCNDRTSNSDAFPLTSSGGNYIFGPNVRIDSNKIPSFKCPNVTNDGFTLKTSGASSSVTASGDGNNMLNYPVGLITIDEAVHAGGNSSSPNRNYYLYTGEYYWVMSPSFFHSPTSYAIMWSVYSNGGLYSTYSVYPFGVRPVINLKSDVLYSNGTGTETDPYIITIQ